MSPLPAKFRRAAVEDAVDMAELVNIAGHGLPLYLWGKTARPGQSAWDVGRERARHGTGGFATRNTVVREVDGKVAACLIGYALAEEPEPIGDDLSPILVPLLELENKVPGTWYINVLAAYPEHRGQGYGSALLGVAEMLARESGCSGISLITSDSNHGARRLYERRGFADGSTRPIVKEEWEHSGNNWVLMLKNF